MAIYLPKRSNPIGDTLTNLAFMKMQQQYQLRQAEVKEKYLLAREKLLAEWRELSQIRKEERKKRADIEAEKREQGYEIAKEKRRAALPVEVLNLKGLPSGVKVIQKGSKILAVKPRAVANIRVGDRPAIPKEIGAVDPSQFIKADERGYAFVDHKGLNTFALQNNLTVNELKRLNEDASNAAKAMNEAAKTAKEEGKPPPGGLTEKQVLDNLKDLSFELTTGEDLGQAQARLINEYRSHRKQGMSREDAYNKVLQKNIEGVTSPGLAPPGGEKDFRWIWGETPRQ